ncbi:adhesion G-protein coupled receptor G1-like [Pelodytes ibericus]
MTPALLLLLLVLCVSTGNAHGFSLCGWRNQSSRGARLRYHGGSGGDTVSLENDQDGLIVRAPFLPSTNISLQELPGLYTFCLHWIPGLNIFNLTHGLQIYTWIVRNESPARPSSAPGSPDTPCKDWNNIINMTLNGLPRNRTCRFNFHLQDWVNDDRFVDHEISMVSQILDTANVSSRGKGFRRWIDWTLSQVQFDGGSRHFGKGMLQAAVFTLDSAEVLSSLPMEMGVSVSLPQQLLKRVEGPPSRRLHVVRIRGSSLFQDAANSTILAEAVIGVSVENTQVSNLGEDVIFLFQHANVQENVSSVCVFWNESTDSWSSHGCLTISRGPQTQCNCSHLTYFAVLMRVENQRISEIHLVSLTALTFAGCTISAIAALFTIFWSCCSRAVHSNPTLQIHIHLLAALFLLDSSFMISALVGALELPLLCKSAAIFLHTAQLCTFSWMAIEGFNLYQLVVKVFDTSINTGKLALVGWGAPVLIVSVITLTSYDHYGSHSIMVDRSSSDFQATICWLTEPVIHLALNVGVFGVVLLLNIGMLIAMTRCVLRLTLHSRGEKVRHCITLLGLSCMLGLPWGVAFFSFGVLYLPMQYTFSILNSLQGFFIFLWYWALSQPRESESHRSSYSASTTPASPRTDQSVIMSDHKKLLT